MIVGLCARKGGQNCHYYLILSCSLVIMQVARPAIGDTPLRFRQCSFLGWRNDHVHAILHPKPANNPSLD